MNDNKKSEKEDVVQLSTSYLFLDIPLMNEMDERITFSKQLEEDVSSVVVISKFKIN